MESDRFKEFAMDEYIIQLENKSGKFQKNGMGDN